MNIALNDGWTPLHFLDLAIDQNRKEFAAILRKLGAQRGAELNEGAPEENPGPAAPAKKLTPEEVAEVLSMRLGKWTVTYTSCW